MSFSILIFLISYWLDYKKNKKWNKKGYEEEPAEDETETGIWFFIPIHM